MKNELNQILKYLKKNGIVYIEVPNLDSKYNLDQIQNAHNYYFTKNTLLHYASLLNLKAEYVNENVSDIHLGVIFSRERNKPFTYNRKDEIKKIISFHKNLLSLGNFIKKNRSQISEKIKNLLGISITIGIRKFIAKLRTW